MLITDQKVLDEFCADIQSEEFLTVDTEFLREKTYYPKLCLIQIGTRDGRAAAIDPLAEGIDLKTVFDLLSNEKILKIFHAARQDLEIFFNLTGKVVHPFFDTQIAAMVCGYGDSIGYENLVRNITGGQIDKSSQYTNWSNRPLSEKQINYALGDVTHLVGVYEHLAAELESRGRTAWVFEEEAVLEDPATYDVDVNEVWKKIKIKSPKPQNLGVLKALAAWRERRAQDKNLPKNWVLRDETLADMAGQMPKDVKGLQKIRNISADFATGHHGATLLQIIKKAQESDPKTWPQKQKKSPLSATVAARFEMLKLLLKLQAAEHDVASKLIATADDLEALAQDEKADIMAMKGWRAEVFGHEAIEMMNGRLAIGMKGGKIQKMAISGES